LRNFGGYSLGKHTIKSIPYEIGSHIAWDLTKEIAKLTLALVGATTITGIFAAITRIGNYPVVYWYSYISGLAVFLFLLFVLGARIKRIFSAQSMLRNVQQILGQDREIKIIYSELILHPSVKEAIKASRILTDDEKVRFDTHALAPTRDDYSRPPSEFRSEKVACVCEVRAAAYLAALFAQVGRSDSLIASSADPVVRAKEHDQSYIALGGFCNKFTLQLLNDPSNDLVSIDISDIRDPKFTCGEKRLTPKRTGEEDYGLIVSIHPRDQKSRTWITCVGLGEYGTSGAAYFLEKHWETIANHLKERTGRFACIVKIRDKNDDSASLYKFAERSQDWVV
jgi:hypothetical protein